MATESQPVLNMAHQDVQFLEGLAQELRHGICTAQTSQKDSASRKQLADLISGLLVVAITASAKQVAGTSLEHAAEEQEDLSSGCQQQGPSDHGTGHGTEDFAEEELEQADAAGAGAAGLGTAAAQEARRAPPAGHHQQQPQQQQRQQQAEVADAGAAVLGGAEGAAGGQEARRAAIAGPADCATSGQQQRQQQRQQQQGLQEAGALQPCTAAPVEDYAAPASAAPSHGIPSSSQQQQQVRQQ
jgi:hypothetical protein